MHSSNKNVERIINQAKADGLVLGENKLLESALIKMYSKSTMHKQVENVVCRLIANFEKQRNNSEVNND